IYLSMRINRRYGEIKKDIPVALDLLILTTNAGLGLDRAFELVAEEISYTNVELGRELVMTSTELSIIPDRRQALKNLAERVDLDLVKEMTTTLIQSEEQGTPISQTLKILSEEFLKKRVLKVEEKASRLPVLLTIPLIVLILPSLFIVLMSPAIIQVFEKM
ncbi:MAG: type II secretion system F family protein, partial [Caedimonadaceae bacterium]